MNGTTTRKDGWIMASSGVHELVRGGSMFARVTRIRDGHWIVNIPRVPSEPTYRVDSLRDGKLKADAVAATVSELGGTTMNGTTTPGFEDLLIACRATIDIVNRILDSRGMKEDGAIDWLGPRLYDIRSRCETAVHHATEGGAV